MTASQIEVTSCRESSLKAGESVAGTAVEHTDFWILIECHDLWAPKIMRCRSFSADLKTYLAEVERDIAGTRIQLIKPLSEAVPGRTRLICVDARHGETPRILSGDLPDIEGVVSVDFEAIRHGHAPSWMRPHTEPLVLICTHAKRDICCGIHGHAFIEALSAEYRPYVWQTSHLGGHRFAPTAVVFPHAYCYGRLSPEEANLFMASVLEGNLFNPDYLRGCTALARPAQYAEIVYRTKTGKKVPGDLFINADAQEENLWEVTITNPTNGERQILQVRKSRSGAPVTPSCGKKAEPSSVYTHDWNAENAG